MGRELQARFDIPKRLFLPGLGSASVLVPLLRRLGTAKMFGLGGKELWEFRGEFVGFF